MASQTHLKLMTYLWYDQGGKCWSQSVELPKAATMLAKILSFELSAILSSQVSFILPFCFWPSKPWLNQHQPMVNGFTWSGYFLGWLWVRPLSVRDHLSHLLIINACWDNAYVSVACNHHITHSSLILPFLPQCSISTGYVHKQVKHMDLENWGVVDWHPCSICLSSL